jgi:hypothetical protein
VKRSVTEAFWPPNELADITIIHFHMLIPLALRVVRSSICGAIDSFFAEDL